ncbi:hypothetical protein [Acidiferrobacter sp.]|uniref:hypothetical protein n=1 Tax=Acidiferrobacter sp. TaxID=1872107 RepID=UPI00263111F6|nr:hypothetical protein [Acidiferrobacter sp.]
MKSRILAIVVACCALWMTSMAPARAGISFSIGISGPQYAFTFGDNLNAYYWPAYSTFIYADNGFYYRWIDGGWVYAPGVAGPWWPIAPGVFLPPALLYGPPPPVIGYRPYFVWWRAGIGPWYARAHPIWWMHHRMFLAHYAVWRARIIPYYQAHPGIFWRRPGMRPVFTRPFIRQQRMRYALHHPRFAAMHPALRARAMHFAATHPRFAGRRPYAPMRRRALRMQRYHRFMAHHPRLAGHPYRARRAFRNRRMNRGFRH